MMFCTWVLRNRASKVSYFSLENVNIIVCGVIEELAFPLFFGGYGGSGCALSRTFLYSENIERNTDGAA